MNKKIVIDAGHGGDDPGASGNGIIEKNLTLKISKELYDYFKKLNIPVYMTRQEDLTIDPKTRTELIKNAFGNDDNVIVLSNHINAGGAVSKICGQTLLKYKRRRKHMKTKALDGLDKIYYKEMKDEIKYSDTLLLCELLARTYYNSGNKYCGVTIDDLWEFMKFKIKYTDNEKNIIIQNASKILKIKHNIIVESYESLSFIKF